TNRRHEKRHDCLPLLRPARVVATRDYSPSPGRDADILPSLGGVPICRVDVARRRFSPGCFFGRASCRTLARCRQFGSASWTRFEGSMVGRWRLGRNTRGLYRCLWWISGCALYGVCLAVCHLCL